MNVDGTAGIFTCRWLLRSTTSTIHSLLQCERKLSIYLSSCGSVGSASPSSTGSSRRIGTSGQVADLLDVAVLVSWMWTRPTGCRPTPLNIRLIPHCVSTLLRPSNTCHGKFDRRSSVLGDAAATNTSGTQPSADKSSKTKFSIRPQHLIFIRVPTLIKAGFNLTNKGSNESSCERA